MNVIFNILKGDYSTNERIILMMFSFSVFLGIIIHYVSMLNGTLASILVLSSILFGFAGILLFMSSYKSNKFTKWLIFLLVYFFVVGISYKQFNIGIRGGDFVWIITSDLRYVMYILIASIVASERLVGYYHLLIRALAIWAIILGIIGILNIDINVKSVIERGTIWGFGYYSWWLSASVCHYWGFYAIIMKKDRIIGYSVLLIYLIMGILFLKRAAIINTLFITFFATFLSYKSVIKSIWHILLILIVFFTSLDLISNVGIRVLDTAVDQLHNRFIEIDRFDEFDRQKEWVNYYETISDKQILFGNGIGHYPSSLRFGSNLIKINALHIGYYNIIFKGGIFLAFLYLFLLLGSIRKFFVFSTLSLYDKVCLGVVISLFVSMFFEGSWGYTLVPLGVYPSMFFLLRSESKLLYNV